MTRKTCSVSCASAPRDGENRLAPNSGDILARMSPDSEEGTETRCAEKKMVMKKIVTIVIAMMTADPDLCLSVFLCVCLCPSLCLCALAFQGETGLSRVQLVQAARRIETVVQYVE